MFDRSEWSRWMAGNELIFRRTLLEESDLTVTTRFRGVAEKADLVERGDAIIAQAAVRPGPVLHIEDVTWMLAVQRRNQLAAVQFCVGERGHLEDDAEHFLCT